MAPTIHRKGEAQRKSAADDKTNEGNGLDSASRGGLLEERKVSIKLSLQKD
jgi:hypothetical protein